MVAGLIWYRKPMRSGIIAWGVLLAAAATAVFLIAVISEGLRGKWAPAEPYGFKYRPFSLTELLQLAVFGAFYTYAQAMVAGLFGLLPALLGSFLGSSLRRLGNFGSKRKGKSQ